MDDMKSYAMEIHKKSDEELNSKRAKIFDYLLSLDVNPDVLLEFCAISIELANRDLMKSLGLS